jgi:hypothetical protein
MAALSFALWHANSVLIIAAPRSADLFILFFRLVGLKLVENVQFCGHAY